VFLAECEKKMLQRFLVLFVSGLVFVHAFDTSSGAEWRVPVGGNAYRTEPQPGNATNREGLLVLKEAEQKYAIYFSVDRPCKVQVSFEARSKGKTIFEWSVANIQKDVVVDSTDFEKVMAGDIEVAEKGYVRIDLKRAKDSEGEVQLKDLIVSSDTSDLKVDYVRDNEGNMFYWGRRGPSVHLGYQVARGLDIQYAYSEVTVPVGEDPIGSYFMANGFGEGYFGIQVNSETERRVLFSVWSPFQTDNPKDIPEEQRIVALGRGPEVRIGEFGNEGSGGQSFLVYPWVAGKTYRFLTEVKPDGNGSTVYTSWFGDKAAGEWRLIASFRRPKTDTHLKGFHSFLESFNPTLGYIGRRCENGNVWVVDTSGKWHECLQARFSVDPTGGNRHRLDFTGGAEGDHFYMRNCGFFNETGRPGEIFTRTSTVEQKPEIDFTKLPQK
jgi:hypothetical protein